MGETTGISWCDHTFNSWIGCARVSPGCAHCYAADLAKNRMGLDVWDGKYERPRKMMSEAYWKQPFKWNREAERDGVRRRVFCASMADVFEDREEVKNARIRLFITIAGTPHLDWLLLTKRPENVARLVHPDWMEHGFPANVWLGTSVENQHWADVRIPILLQIPAKVRFLSCEPLLGSVDLHLPTYPYGVHWVIVGGESGPKHRPMQLDWARHIQDQCTLADVPFFFKQIGGRTSKSGGDLLGEQQYHAWPKTGMEASVHGE